MKKVYPFVEIFLIFSLLFVFVVITQAQTHFLELNQPPPLVAEAGPDQSIISGAATQIGGSPTASGGYGSYLYQWEPASGLDNPTSANPIASPASTTTYLLTITDANNCRYTDQVTVEVKANNLLQFGPEEIRLYPNPSGGQFILEIPPQCPVESISLHTLWGQKLGDYTELVTQKKETAFNLSFLPKGVYFLSIGLKDQVLVKRLLIE